METTRTLKKGGESAYRDDEAAESDNSRDGIPIE